MISRVLPQDVRKLHNETKEIIGTQLLTQADKEHFEDNGYFEAFDGDEYFKSDKFVSDFFICVLYICVRYLSMVLVITLN